MWRPLGPTSRATSSASMACSTCRPVPTARASRPSRAAPASSATATLTCSGSWSLAWSVLVVGWVSFGTAVPFWSSVLADARHLPHGRSQAGTATSTSTGTGTTSRRQLNELQAELDSPPTMAGRRADAQLGRLLHVARAELADALTAARRVLREPLAGEGS